MGSGGSRGLQNRCFGAEASKGWFDSDTPPPRSPQALEGTPGITVAMAADMAIRFRSSGCLFSIIASVLLTIVLNLMLRGCSY